MTYYAAVEHGTNIFWGLVQNPAEAPDNHEAVAQPADYAPQPGDTYDPATQLMVHPPPPAPAIEAGDNLPRWVYTTGDGTIVGAGATEAIPAPYATAGATEAHYLADYPTHEQHWDKAARAYRARPEPQPGLERTLIDPLLDHLARMERFKEVATAAGIAATPAIDARIAELRTDLALLAGAYDAPPPSP